MNDKGAGIHIRQTAMECDVLIVGGGPAGSSVGSLLRTYDPSLRVIIVEREVFPRDHIGESQLPATCKVLHEMGAWDKVEAAGFPIKVGSTYRWGLTDELWQVNFLEEEIQDRPRPSPYEGQRIRTAFQVDRSIYDKILLDHAAELGCEVFQNTKVTAIQKEGDRVQGVTVGPGKPTAGEKCAQLDASITARYYVDASGGSGVLRRALDVPVDSPSNLHNIALWDYWQDAKWAETIGKSGTRAQIMSIGWGWIWFIPITSTRTSIGFVTPASYLKSCGKKPEELYMEAIAIDPRISQLVVDARREGIFQATKDWSYLADRLAGDNWFLCGDSCGFADPILSAGMTLAQVGARKVAYSILELERKEVDETWVKSEYTRSHRSNISQHIRFADYWYSANGCFTDLNEYCRQIAKESGLDLTPEGCSFSGSAREDLLRTPLPMKRRTSLGLQRPSSFPAGLGRNPDMGDIQEKLFQIKYGRCDPRHHGVFPERRVGNTPSSVSGRVRKHCRWAAFHKWYMPL